MSKKQAPLTELVDADIRRIDAVKGPASGNRFLIAKADGQAGMVPAETVRALIAEPEGDVYTGDGGVVIEQPIAKATLSLPDGMTLDALRQAIAAALHEAGFTDCYVADVMPGSVIYCVGDNFDAYYRTGWTMDTGGKVTITGTPEPVRQDHQWEPIAKTRVKKQKETPVTTRAATAEKAPAAVTGSVKEAKAVLKQAARVKKARQLAKRALLAEVNALGIKKGTLGSLGDAHKAVLDALQNEAGKQADGEPSDVMTALQGMASKIAALMGDHAAGGGDAEAEPAGEPDGDEAPEALIEKKANLKKTRNLAKAAKLAKQTARNEIKTAKARKTLAKIGRRNNAADQGHVDAIDEHAAALGATAHLSKNDGTPVIAKGTETIDHTIELIQQVIGPLMKQDREAIQGDLAQIREQVTKVAKTPLPGGPRVIVDRDGSVLTAGEGQQGMSADQAVLMKAAEHFQVGSVEREKLEKKAATLAIGDLMAAQRNQ